jgi:hypothetical protein
MTTTTPERALSFTSTSATPVTSLPSATPVTQPRCVTCGRAFDFEAGESAVVLRHVAYGYDLAHDGACLTAANDRLFLEPGFDGAAFGADPERTRIVQIAPADGWFAARPETPRQVLAGRLLRFEPLRWWALVERDDGTRRVEGLARDSEWDDADGGLEFAQAWRGSAACIGYTRRPNQPSAATRSRWAALVAAAYRGKSIQLNAPAFVAGPSLRRAA